MICHQEANSNTITEKSSEINLKVKSCAQVCYIQSNIQKKNNGAWTYNETKQYGKFLLSNIKTFESEQKRRKRRIFEKMANRITTRSAAQCRSHHQKMEKAHGDVDKIIESIMQKNLKKASLIKTFESDQSSTTESLKTKTHSNNTTQDFQTSKMSQEEFYYDVNFLDSFTKLPDVQIQSFQEIIYSTPSLSLFEMLL